MWWRNREPVSLPVSQGLTPGQGRRRWADLVVTDPSNRSQCASSAGRSSELDTDMTIAPTGATMSGRTATAPESGETTGSVRAFLEIEPGLWWLGWREGRLIVEVTRVESYVDSAGVVWAVVEGWRHLTGRGRCWSRDLVHPAALPPELLASPDAHCSARPRGDSA